MLRRPLMCPLIVPLLAVAPLVARAQRLERTPKNPTREQVEAQLRYQTGRVTVRGGLATLDLPADFRYLDPQETDIVLRAWGNPPGHETLGMLVPASVRVLAPEGWGVIISFSEDGYVKDAVASMDRLESIRRDMAKVIGFVEFNGGHRYADFIPGTDKVAEYGIAALIAGGLAAKAGLFKVLLGALVALKKVIALGLIAAAAFLRRLFRRKPADAAARL